MTAWLTDSITFSIVAAFIVVLGDSETLKGPKTSQLLLYELSHFVAFKRDKYFRAIKRLGMWYRGSKVGTLPFILTITQFIDINFMVNSSIHFKLPKCVCNNFVWL